MLQFLITLSDESVTVINSFHPVNFDYVNRVLSESGFIQSAKKITFLGEVRV